MNTTWTTMGRVTLGDVIVVGRDRVTIRSIDPVSLKPGRIDIRGVDERGDDIGLYSVRKARPVQVQVA